MSKIHRRTKVVNPSKTTSENRGIEFKNIPDTLTGNLQDNVLTLLVVSEKYCKEVMEQVDLKLFSNRVIRVVVEKAYKYISKHGKPPGTHMADELAKELEGDDAELYQAVLDNIEAILNRPGFNEDYLHGRLLEFVALQRGKKATTDMVEAMESGDVARIYEVAGQFAASEEGYRKATGEGVQLIRGDEVTVADHDWRWEGYLAAKQFHVLAGPPGTGKSTVALHLASVMTRTSIRWPDNTRNIEALPVLIWSGEDDVETTLAPRLKAMGADMSKVYFLSTVVDEGTRPFDPSQDMSVLARKVREIGRIGMLIIDPIVSAVAGDSHKNAEVRRGLQPVVDFCRQHECVLIGVTHFTKGTQGKDPVERVTGSLAFGAIPRMVLAFAAIRLPERDDPGVAIHDRMMVRAKSNIGPTGGGFYYRLERRPVPGKRFESQVVAWNRPIDGEARTILATAEVQDKERPSEFLAGLLANGAMIADDVFKAAQEQGYTREQMQNAASHLKVDRKKTSLEGGWEWTLPPKR